jgi:bifunctional UDP-N-acetylglucosamine pyrophosphorylase / glucosamine-1-phosphate N-acetyltransferase
MTRAPISALVLAAGEGARMRSGRPKPLHPLCGRPMVMHVLHALAGVAVRRTAVVVGHGAEQVAKKITEQCPASLHVTFVEQSVQRGTGDAVIVGLTAFHDDDIDEASTIVVLSADMPLLQASTIVRLIEHHEESAAAGTVLTARVGDPTGYGRIVRGKENRVVRIVEQRDASADERAIDEINTGVYCFRRDLLGPALRRLSPDNSQGEYYLTDVVEVLSDAGYAVGALMTDDAAEVHGVNDRWQLALAERELRARTNRRWMLGGVTMLDARQTFIDVTVELNRDITIYPGTILQGRTTVAEGCDLGPATHLVDCAVGVGAVVEHTVGHDAEIGPGAHVGPYAVLEPGASVAPGAVTGAFYTGKS